MRTLTGGLVAVLFFGAAKPCYTEFRYWNLDGEERVIPENLSVRDVSNALRALKRGLKSAVRNRTNPEAVWSEGRTLFRQFFGDTQLAINGSIAGGRLSGTDSKLTLLNLQQDLAKTEGTIERLKNELIYYEQLTGILPTESHTARSDLQKKAQDFRSNIEKAEERLEGLYDLRNTLAEFQTDLRSYQEKLLSALAREIGTDAQWEVSMEAEKAIEKVFQNDPAIAAAFQRAMLLGESPILFASSETALKLFLLAGDSAGKHLAPIERIRALPGAGWSEASRPLLAKLEKEYGVKNTAEISLSAPVSGECRSEFDRLFRSKQSPELN